MTKEMQTLALAPVGNLESYIRAANTWPMLSADEERELAEKLHYQGDLEAAKKLILSHLRFVVHIARNYSGYGLPQADSDPGRQYRPDESRASLQPGSGCAPGLLRRALD